ncbi:MAG: RluA family pseudouridine synthase [Lachnospiraceae bacterium]|nr:RluA family pseudouridine synthase [Lachnospiraceae bacterium]
MTVFSYRISDKDAGIRLDRFLSEKPELPSRSYLQRLIGEGQVLVDRRPVKSNYRLQAGKEITVSVPEPKELSVEAEPMDLDILYEDEDVVLVNKPKGMVVHPGAGHLTGTLVNGLMYHCRGQLSGINGILRPGIVHRIDMDTTGILVVCKNDQAHKSIAAQLKEHSITRRYWAIVHGRIDEEEITVDAPIGRHPTERKKMSIHARNGKPAITHITVIKQFKGYAYVECRLETGRTHQIRVHMASIGHPLLGDRVYGPDKCPFPQLRGQTLHAGILGFVHPRTGQYMEFNAPLPEYFRHLLDKLEKIK